MSEMWYWNKSRLISLIICIVYLAITLWKEDGKTFVVVFGFSFFCLACIWFGDEVGAHFWSPRGNSFNGVPNQPSPGVLVRFMGWVMLSAPAIIAIVISFSNKG